MESIQPQIEDLMSNVDDLELALQPILKTALSSSTSKLPLLDKAKLYVLATYAIESILFSYLRLNGVDAKAHPVFQELSRVKEYFNKIKSAETAGVGAKSRLDKGAAGRFIKNGLAGNDKYDADRRERQERERAGAKRKLEAISTGTHTRFDGAAKRIREDGGPKVGVVRVSELEEDDGEDAGSRSGKIGTSGANTPADSDVDGSVSLTSRPKKARSKEYEQLTEQIEKLKANPSRSQKEDSELKRLRKQRKKVDRESQRTWS